MKIRKLLGVLLALAMLAPAAGCGLAEGAGVTATDMQGREISLAAPATRIVALSAADCEILCALGAGDLLVGRGEYCDYPETVLAVPAVQSGAETNLEQIVALGAQVLFMSSMAQTEAQVQQLEGAGVRVVASDAQTLQGTYEAIRLIGALVGKSEAAETLVQDMQADFTALAAAPAAQGKTVYFEVSPLQYGLWTAGQGTFMDEIATLLGLTNCFYDVQGWGEVSQEQVIERNPDYIVTISMYTGPGPTPVEELAGREGWQGITAIRNGAVLNLVQNELTRPGPRLVNGAQLLRDFVTQSAAQTPAA